MVTQGSTAHSVGAPDRDGAYELLRGRYEAYCGQQAAALLAMLPRDGVRALYRSARGQVTGEVVDPLALLVQECRRVLPLPPFEIWAQDYLGNRRDHIEEMERGAGPVRALRRPLTCAAYSTVGGIGLLSSPSSASHRCGAA